MKRFLTLYVTPIIGAILIIIKVPDVDSWLKSKFTNGSLIIGMVLVAATILTHIFTVISPFKKFEKIEKNKWSLVDILANAFLKDKIFEKYKVSANVMLTKGTLFNRIEPSKKDPKKRAIRWRKKVFKVVWVLNNATIDRRLKLTVNQGTSGIAYSSGKLIIKDFSVDNDLSTLNLNEEQQRVISGKGFIISYPIFAYDERYSRLNNSTIIGVVNISCNMPGSEALINNDKNRQLLTKKIVDFSKIISLIV